MIVTKTPNRTSICGGGADYPSFYRKYGGLILAGSINKYSYIQVRKLPPFFDYKTRLSYSLIETVKSNWDIQHKVIRACIIDNNLTHAGLEISHSSDLPSGVGVGSSSTFTVGLINALTAVNGDIISSKRLAESAIYVEQNMCEETVGIQDQICAAYGGLNIITIKKDGEFTVEPLPVGGPAKRRLAQSLVMLYTGVSRSAHKIASGYVGGLPAQKNTKELLTLTDKAINAVLKENVSGLGEVLTRSWEIKKSLSGEVSSGNIDEIYERGIKAGALGGKLCGAGGGGMFLFAVPPEKRASFIESFPGQLVIDFQWEDVGSRLLFMED